MMTREPFAGATGAGIRVAAIDSGVNPNHPHIGRVSGGVAVAPDGRVEPDVFSDLLGHGTAVMAAIQEKAPDAAYYAVRVFERELRTTARALLGGLDWCIENRMDVVNLSLGTVNPECAVLFEDAVRRAAAAGVSIVAARAAEGSPCYPGCLPGVVGVDVDWDCPRACYGCGVDSGQLVLRASGYPRPIPGVPQRRNLYGISFAVANACGFVVRALQARPSEGLARALSLNACGPEDFSVSSELA